MGKISLLFSIVALVAFLNVNKFNIAPISLVAVVFGLMFGHMNKIYSKKHDLYSKLSLIISYITLMLLFGFIASGGG